MSVIKGHDQWHGKCGWQVQSIDGKDITVIPTNNVFLPKDLNTSSTPRFLDGSLGVHFETISKIAFGMILLMHIHYLREMYLRWSSQQEFVILLYIGDKCDINCSRLLDCS